MNYNRDNKFALKYKTNKARKRLCLKYCNHLTKGLSQESFSDCSYKTIESYISRYPDDFPIDKIEKAKRQGRLFWEKVGMDGMMGKIKGFNAKVWGFNFKNRFGWQENPEQINDEKIIVNFAMPPSQFIKNAKT